MTSVRKGRGRIEEGKQTEAPGALFLSRKGSSEENHNLEFQEKKGRGLGVEGNPKKT